MILSSTVTGASHLDVGKECQDYSMTWQNRSGSIQIAAVSDGHGSETFYNSALGAQLACHVAIDVLKEVAYSIGSFQFSRKSEVMNSICRAVLARWNQAVDSVRGKDGAKSFGCTLIAYLQTDKYWLAIQIGDGKFVVKDKRNVWFMPIPWDDRCILNYTTSMSDESAVDNFRFAVSNKQPKAVFLSSDGIDGTFEDGELMYNFYNNIYKSALLDGESKIIQDLPAVLSHFSEVGSRDDMSLAIIINHKSIS